jgi:hypothetical protein
MAGSLNFRYVVATALGHFRKAVTPARNVPECPDLQLRPVVAPIHCHNLFGVKAKLGGHGDFTQS